MNFKKPKFWDYEEPDLIAYILLPFTIILKISNFVLKFSNKKKFRDIKTLCVGNIYLGGTGKTPMVAYLVELLQKDHKIAVLSRGYKRKTSGLHTKVF